MIVMLDSIASYVVEQPAQAECVIEGSEDKYLEELEEELQMDE